MNFKLPIALVGALAASAITLAQTVGTPDTIIDGQGIYYTAPPGYKAVFVPDDTPDVVVVARGVKIITPTSRTCRQRDRFGKDFDPNRPECAVIVP